MGGLVKVDLGHGRGWASPTAAASIRRIDRALGRPADINEAGRSPEKADENYRKWIAYQNGGPWAPYALPASQSVHCWGNAADSDDWYNAAAAAVWRDHGWRQTARYNDDRDEPWHGEHFPNLDNHRNDPEPAALEDDMTVEDLHTAFGKKGGQPVKAGQKVNLHINDKKDVTVARGLAKHVSGNLAFALTGGKAYAGAVQVTPVVRTYKAGKEIERVSLRARETIFTGGETLGEVAVNCALRADQRLSFEIGGAAFDFTVKSATFRGMKIT
jgi:hypothetical protein